MLTKYFENLQKTLTKKKTSRSSASADSAGKKTSSGYGKIDVKDVLKVLAGIIPSDQCIGQVRPVDDNGFSPDGADLVIYENYCRDIAEMMEGYIPIELVTGACYVIPSIDKKSLADALNRVISVKKINKYSTRENEDSFRIPAFIVAGDGDYPVRDLKNDVLNYYHNKNAEEDWQFDILMIAGRGLLIKNWRERTYVALETGSDTLMFFFMLLDEYLNVKRNADMDFRRYIKSEKNYNEF